MSAPKFEYRGFMLDVSRHFMPVEDVEKLIEAASLCGMNRMHWHLTDDQGWRVEIRRYPELTRVGSRRGWSWFGPVSGVENNCGFYTQDEIRRVVEFARARGVEIMPEIELPGHASALLAALPDCGCRALDDDGGIVERPHAYRVETAPGIFPNLICAGREAPIRVLEAILDEIVELFPFPMVHIGGDEALKLHWRRCPDCQARMRQEGIASEDALQRWLVLRIGDYLAKKGRSTVVWNDVLAGGPLPGHFVVQQWMGSAPLTRAFMAGGGRVICSDTRYYYFDYAYGTTDVHTVWDHPMIPDYARGFEANLLGVECPLWTERVTNLDRAAFMLLPRMTAVALRANGDDSPDWERFCQRLRAAETRVEELGLRGAPEPMWRMTPEMARADREEERAAIRAQGALPFVEKEERLVTLEETERLMERIGMPRPFLLRVGNVEMARIDGAAPGADDDGAGVLARHLTQAVQNRADGPWAGLPEDVWLDTMAAFTRFVEEHHRATGRYGFDRGFWTTRQVEARLFRIGTLEYELCGADGARFVDLHIPTDVHLRPDALNDSVRRARAFLRTYFPAWGDAPMRCDSWLLSPALRDLLPERSNILRFQAAFDITESDAADDSALQWIFTLSEAQAAAPIPRDLPTDTTLRRNVAALLRRGGHVGSAVGTLARAFE